MNQDLQTQSPVPSEPRHHRRGIFWPLFLIAAGVIFLLYNMGMINDAGWSLVWNLWPVLFIVGGLDSLWRGDGLAGPIFWIGLGVLFLMGNLGYLPMGTWELIWRFWPVLLIVIGIDVIIGHRAGRTVWGQVVSVILALVVLGGLAWFVINQPALRGVRVETQQISEALPASVTTADWNINVAAGKLTVQGGAGSGQLVTGSINTRNQSAVTKDLRVSGSQATYTIRESGNINGFNVGGDNDPWDLRLNDAVASDLRVSMGAGETLIDTATLNMRGLDANLGAGKLTIVLHSGSTYDGKVNVAVGELVVRVPRDLPVRIITHSAISGVSVDGNFRKDGNVITSIAASGDPVVTLDVNNAVGSIRIEPAD